MKTYEEILRDFRICYDKGARILDIEGVNLLRWKDGDKGPADIFAAARSIGFYNTSTMIPATDWQEWSRLNVDVDVTWISIKGKEDLGRLEMETTGKASLYMVIDNRSYGDIPEVLEFMEGRRKLEQIAFNFHTPFPGTEGLALTKEQRVQVIDSLIAYRKKGHRIMNSTSGLRNMLSLDFKRYCWICNFIYCDGRQSPVCIDDQDSGICGKCGFSMSGEMNAVLRFRPDTILAGLKLRK